MTTMYSNTVTTKVLPPPSEVYNISAVVIPSGYGTVFPVSATIKYGGSQSFIVTTSGGYSFLGWVLVNSDDITVGSSSSNPWDITYYYLSKLGYPSGYTFTLKATLQHEKILLTVQ